MIDSLHSHDKAALHSANWTFSHIFHQPTRGAFSPYTSMFARIIAESGFLA